jgi:hypothetical protein
VEDGNPDAREYRTCALVRDGGQEVPESRVDTLIEKPARAQSVPEDDLRDIARRPTVTGVCGFAKNTHLPLEQNVLHGENVGDGWLRWLLRHVGLQLMRMTCT